MTNLQIEMSLAALALFIIILISLKKNSMSIKNSVAWLLLPIMFIIIAIFPDPFSKLATSLGFETLSNFIFVIIIALLIIVCFSLTITISHQQSQIVKLIQNISLLKMKDQNKHKNKSEKSNSLKQQ